MSMSITRVTTFAALAAFACTGLMQAEEHASFHLPITAHWGSVVLEPGDYRIAFPDASMGERTFRVEHTGGKTVRELPLVISPQQNSDRSSLRLQEIDGDYFIREFSSGPTGKSFLFPVPKTNHRQQAVAVVNTIATEN